MSSQDVHEIRDILLACAQVGPAPMGVVRCEDESHEQQAAKFERFRRIDSLAVPVAIEWVMVLHTDVVARMGVDLRIAAAVAGALADRQGDYWWIVLSQEPFSFLKESCTARYQALKEAVGLEAVHTRFPRHIV